MNVEDNQRVIEAFVDAFNRRDWERLENLHAESVVYWTPDNIEPKRGRAGIRDLFVGYTSAFPDARNQKERVLGQGDWVCVELVFTGTLMGTLTSPDGKLVQGTKKHVKVPWVSMHRLDGGQITEWHAYWDALGMWVQLGFRP
jgi:steroid delta-isomerase-like uncharacterized protein